VAGLEPDASWFTLLLYLCPQCAELGENFVGKGDNTSHASIKLDRYASLDSQPYVLHHLSSIHLDDQDPLYLFREFGDAG
jgi:hypothetical protein